MVALSTRASSKEMSTNVERADGDNCGVIESTFAITHAQFLQWNPAVSADCLSGFWGGKLEFSLYSLIESPSILARYL